MLLVVTGGVGSDELKVKAVVLIWLGDCGGDNENGDAGG